MIVIEDYLDIPYQHHGRTVHGLDCLGLALMIYKAAGIPFPDEEYPPDWHKKCKKDRFLSGIADYWVQVFGHPVEYDLILLKKSDQTGFSQHAGVCLDRFRFIHCSKAGVSICRLEDRRWTPLIKGIYRYVGKRFT